MKVLYKTKYIELRENNGWTYAHRGNSGDIVIIIPLINESEILFLKTKRPPLMSEGKTGFNIELPAGLTGDIFENEDMLESAKRELLEETGLVADEYEILTKNLTSSAGMCDENSVIFLARISNDEIQKKPIDDGGVIVERVRIKVQDIPNWLQNEEKAGNTLASQTLSGLFLFLCHNKLKD